MQLFIALTVTMLLWVLPVTSDASDCIVLGASGQNASCEGFDLLTTYTVNHGDVPQPSKVWEGQPPRPECPCLVDYIPYAKPISTNSNGDVKATFSRVFHLTTDLLGMDYHLTIVADDGAKIIMNNVEVATIDLDDPNLPFVRPPRMHVILIPSQLLVEGENELSIYVVNTGNGRFGSPLGRGGPGDCMYVMYSLASCPLPVESSTWGLIKNLYR